jgi:hypothetical protein
VLIAHPSIEEVRHSLAGQSAGVVQLSGTARHEVDGRQVPDFSHQRQESESRPASAHADEEVEARHIN